MDDSPKATLADEFGQIDIYLFDQLVRGRIFPGMTVLDAGCGGGRNLVYLLRAGYDVYGVDSSPSAVAAVQRMAARLAPQLPADHFRIEAIEHSSLPDAFFDAVLSSAVLHFAQDDDQFIAMLEGMWRVLKPGGLFFCRLASMDGVRNEVRPLGRGRFLLPDGSERYLVDEARLLDLTKRLGGTLLDPLKTTIVHGERAMATWIVHKDV